MLTTLLRVCFRVLLPTLILAAGVWGFIQLSQRPDVAAEEGPPKTDPLVECVAVLPHESGLDIETDGVVVPHREIYLAAEVEGRITFKADECRAGNYVEAGTLLFEIDARDYELEVERLNKEAAQAEANLRENEVEIKNAETMVQLAEEDLALQRQELQRALDLARRKVNTEADIDAAKRSELAARNALQTQKNMLQLQITRRNRLVAARELVGTQLDKAKLALSRTKITAPIAGLIVEDMVEEDTHVKNGTSLVRINDSSTAEVKCGLKMEELYWIWNQTEERYPVDRILSPEETFEVPETPVTVTYRLMDQNFHWDGVLSRYEGTGLDVATRTVPTRVVVSNPREFKVTDGNGNDAHYRGPGSLVTGMYVTIRVHARPSTRLLAIPENAVRPGNRIWVVRNGQLTIDTIAPAETIDGMVIFPADSGTVEAGDRVVTSPLAAVRDGMHVRDATQPPAVGPRE